ncbi:hypothetical protein [Cupriavidus plantarum]|uniref:hypothetical protein n=1 Tax=Cupriavidus plantarum TaxID=942865 RepID=UPI00339D5FB0
MSHTQNLHTQSLPHAAGCFPNTLTPRDPGHVPLKAGAFLFAGILASLSAVFAIVEYSSRDLKDALARIETQFDSRLNRLETRFDQRFDRIESQVQALDRKVDRLEIRLDKVQASIAPKRREHAGEQAGQHAAQQTGQQGDLQAPTR